MQLEFPEPKWWQKIFLTLAATRLISSLLSRILAKLDRFALSVTSEKQTLTTIMSGLPVVRLTTYGRVSGKPRICPLIPLPEGANLVLFATNFGAQRHPSWYLNLKANPNVLVSLNGRTASFFATDADDSVRSRYWRKAEAMYPGYRQYKKRAGGRRIPIVVLSPRQRE